MKFRPMLRTSFNARMTFGRRRLRSSAALLAWQTRTINEYEVLSYSQAELPPDVLQAMGLKFTTSPGSAPKRPTTSATLWSVGTASYQDLEDALQMFSEECSGPH